ncbi:threonine synthase [Algibacter lectus]|nr:threonine synthase [Algibacter lectus]GAL77925.1 threonine synthase [Algibacter lectus]
MLEIFNTYNYVADPHGAVGYLGSKNYLKDNPNAHCVFLETAHPTKFLDVVEKVIKEKQPLPEQIQSVMGREKVAVSIATYNDLKDFLLS